MNQTWSNANYWIPDSFITERFWFRNWTDFIDQSPYESNVWKARGLRLLSWSISQHHDIQVIQIVFLVKDPFIEMMYFEIPVKDSEKGVIETWLAERIPPFWKNLGSS